jgi:hypothetical protein
MPKKIMMMNPTTAAMSATMSEAANHHAAAPMSPAPSQHRQATEHPAQHRRRPPARR